MSGVEFNGLRYHDDRMFVVATCRCSVEVDSEETITTIYHEDIPEDAMWCLATYRNVARYDLVRVDHFSSEEDALAYRQRVEPQVPIVSLGGRARKPPLSYTDYVAWKEKHSLTEYDYTLMYQPGGRNAREIAISKS